MNAVYRITGYDKRSERPEIEHDIPPERLIEVRELAAIPASAEGALGVPLRHKS